jgi:plastocyanin
MRLAAPALLWLAATAPAPAATLFVDVLGARDGRVTNAVAWAVPDGHEAPPASRVAVLDQRNRTFVPHVLPVQVGTAVKFPNSDNVRHQVYSFSPAKKFQLPLYAGTPASPVVFDKAGVVTLGCNIHDRMSAYIVVVDTPYFAPVTEGRAKLSGLPEGRYEVRVWSPGLREEPPAQVVLLAAHEEKTVAFRTGIR